MPRKRPRRRRNDGPRRHIFAGAKPPREDRLTVLEKRRRTASLARRIADLAQSLVDRP